jgi:hypothetical protein
MAITAKRLVADLKLRTFVKDRLATLQASFGADENFIFAIFKTLLATLTAVVHSRCSRKGFFLRPEKPLFAPFFYETFFPRPDFTKSAGTLRFGIRYGEN